MVEYQIHWLALTIKRDRKAGLDLFENIFQDRFGPLIPLGNGGRGYQEILISTLGIKLYCTPSNEKLNAKKIGVIEKDHTIYF